MKVTIENVEYLLTGKFNQYDGATILYSYKTPNAPEEKAYYYTTVNDVAFNLPVLLYFLAEQSKTPKCLLDKVVFKIDDINYTYILEEKMIE